MRETIQVWPYVLFCIFVIMSTEYKVVLKSEVIIRSRRGTTEIQCGFDACLVVVFYGFLLL